LQQLPGAEAPRVGTGAAGTRSGLHDRRLRDMNCIYAVHVPQTTIMTSAAPSKFTGGLDHARTNPGCGVADAAREWRFDGTHTTEIPARITVCRNQRDGSRHLRPAELRWRTVRRATAPSATGSGSGRDPVDVAAGPMVAAPGAGGTSTPTTSPTSRGTAEQGPRLGIATAGSVLP
jgi:hypothetical protein